MFSPHTQSAPAAPPASATRTDQSVPESSRSFSLTKLLGVVFIVSQALFIGYTHLARDSWRRLTPVDGLTRYELHATFRGRNLSTTDLQQRYGLRSHGESGLTADALRAVVHHREKPIPVARALLVRVRTREPKSGDAYWLWPQE